VIQEKFLSEKESQERLRRVITKMTVKKEITEDKGDKTPFFFFLNYILFMSKSKDKLKLMMERYLNIIKKDEIELMYGKGTTVKIHTINFSITTTSMIVEAVIILGETINEESLDRRLVDYLIQDSIPYFFPELTSCKVMVRWDV
jgi:hypothetical protein